MWLEPTNKLNVECEHNKKHAFPFFLLFCEKKNFGRIFFSLVFLILGIMAAIRKLIEIILNGIHLPAENLWCQRFQTSAQHISKTEGGFLLRVVSGH
jgi:hypothetical protein